MVVIQLIRNIFTCTLLAIIFTTGVSAREKLYVFYPSTLYPQSMQERMADALKKVTITVFGRYDNFMEKVKDAPPDALISKTALIRDQLPDYTIAMNGERDGSTDGHYVIISTDKQFTVSSVDRRTVIGVIDILGRQGMRSFLKQFFTVEPKMKRVSRVADLLPIVSLKVAAGILIEEVFVDYFKSTSNMQFSVVPLTGTDNGIVACAVRKGKKAKKILSVLQNNDKTICDLFYITQWK